MLQSCPEPSLLKSFAVGQLDEHLVDDFVQHLGHCVDCENVLAKYDDYADGLVSELRDTELYAEGKRISVPPAVLAAAKAAPGGSDLGLSASGTSSSVTSNVSLDPGRAYAKRLASGPVQIGKFQLQHELGDGSFGYVFAAIDTELDRQVAVKIGRSGSIAGETEVKRFLREAQSAAQLNHPHIVAVYDSGQTEDGVCFLVCEFIDGLTLEQQMERQPMTQKQAAQLVAELAEALAYAHSHGVVHRDIKPSNILIDRQGHPHITDFGLAKRLVSDQTLTSDGRVMGTPAYMSPEQALGNSHNVDARSDVYSLGVVLYELLAGERPFQGGRRLMLLQVLEDEPRSPRSLNSNVHRDLETICLRAMAKSPPRRYQSAGEFAEDVRRHLAGDPISARPIGAAERMWRWCRRYPLAASIMVAVVLGSAIGFAYLSHLSTWFVQETALDSVRMEADMLERINKYYSEEVVGRLDWEEVKVTHEYSDMKNALPLPATFTIDAGERISEGTTGMQVRMYSDYPWRKSGGPEDEFQSVALSTLRQQAAAGSQGLEFHEFSTKGQRPVVRYARAQVMQESCVKCHNQDKQSPKRDWQVGDVGGVLSITRPLDRDIARTRSGLKGAFGLMAASALVLIGVSFGFLYGSRSKLTK